MMSKVETMTRLEKELLARSLCCMRVAWTLGHALAVTRSNRERAHRRRWRSFTEWVVEAGALARWWWILGQKKRTGVRSIYAKGIGKWPSQPSATRRRVGSCYRQRRERERVWAGPSSQRCTPASSRNQWQVARAGVPCSGWLMGRPWLVFLKLAWVWFG
jgi:hypothetical protein